ncbi:hypothetical protein Ancab_035599 [Ancistrocladus abbreviatus]
MGAWRGPQVGGGKEGQEECLLGQEELVPVDGVRNGVARARKAYHQWVYIRRGPTGGQSQKGASGASGYRQRRARRVVPLLMDRGEEGARRAHQWCDKEGQVKGRRANQWVEAMWGKNSLSNSIIGIARKGKDRVYLRGKGPYQEGGRRKPA